ncbi:MAG: GAF domain-containing protein [Chloroflexi bacterium]|nr:MAG: GAF domain-containing protein [Chloroflexota bacterium]
MRIAAQVQLSDGLPWPSISFAILVAALMLSAFVLWRRYLSRQQLLQRIAEFEALSAAGRAIVAAELDLTALCELIATEAEKVIDASTFQTAVFDDNWYRILFWRINGVIQETPRNFNLQERGGMVGWIRESKQPLLVRDFAKEMDKLPAVPRYISETPPRSAIFIPLISGEDVIGIVAAQNQQPKRFNEEDLRRLMILANQAAAAIAHAKLYAKEQNRAAQLELVGKIARQIDSVQEPEEIFEQVVQLVHTIFGFHPVSIFLCDAESGELVMQASSHQQLSEICARIPAGRGLVGTAVLNQTTLISNNIQDDKRFLAQIPTLPLSDISTTRSEIAIPLLANGEVLGILDVQSERLGAFTPAQEATLQTLGAEVAIAIDKTKQLTRQREQAWLSTAQLQIADAIWRSEDLEEMATAVSRLTAMLIGVPFVCLLLWEDEPEQYQLTGLHTEHGSGWLPEPVTISIGSWHALDAVHIGQETITTPQIPGWLHPHLPKGTMRLTLVPMNTAVQTSGILVTTEIKVESSDQIEQHTLQKRHELLNNIARQTAQAIESSQLRIAQQEEAWVNTALLQVAEAVNSLIDLNEILNTIVRLVPMLVGVRSTLILIWDEDRSIFHAGPSYGVNEMGRGLLESLAIDRDELERMMPQTVETSVPTGTSYKLTLPHWLQQAFGTDNAHIFPLHARGELVGMMIVGIDEENGRFISTRRLNILNGIAHQAATAVVNNQLYKESAERGRLAQELDVARNIQSSLIPPGSPHIPGCSVASFWQAARQVSGDFYDFIELPDHKWGIVIADVADKGIPAALFMAMSRTIIRTIAHNRMHPSETLIRVNQIIDSEAQSDLFVTVFYAVLDPQKHTLTYANGGHNPPILLRQNGDIELLRGDGMALGIIPDVTIAESSVRLHHGDTLIFYTDGVTEAMNEDYDEFSMGRLQVTASRFRHRQAENIMHAITHAVNDHAGDTPQFDDITLVVLKMDE